MEMWNESGGLRDVVTKIYYFFLPRKGRAKLKSRNVTIFEGSHRLAVDYSGSIYIITAPVSIAKDA